LEVRFLEQAELDGLVRGDLDRAQASARIEERKELSS
jgi:hypothetical protein